MELKPTVPESGGLFRQTLVEMINLQQPLVKLADVIDWDEINRTFSAHFVSHRGRPALSPFGQAKGGGLPERCAR